MCPALSFTPNFSSISSASCGARRLSSSFLRAYSHSRSAEWALRGCPCRPSIEASQVRPPASYFACWRARSSRSRSKPNSSSRSSSDSPASARSSNCSKRWAFSNTASGYSLISPSSTGSASRLGESIPDSAKSASSNYAIVKIRSKVMLGDGFQQESVPVAW
jgi:hypothetical protein